MMMICQIHSKNIKYRYMFAVINVASLQNCATFPKIVPPQSFGCLFIDWWQVKRSPNNKPLQITERNNRVK